MSTTMNSALQRLRIARAHREAPVVEPYQREIERGAAMVRRLSQERDTLSKVITSPMAQLELRGARDRLVDEIVREAIKSAKSFAEETAESGDYRVRISIPPLHIERMVSRREMLDFSRGAAPLADATVRIVNIGERTR